MREDAGSVTVNVSVIRGTISEDVIITLSTAPGGTATGMYARPTIVNILSIKVLYMLSLLY